MLTNPDNRVTVADVDRDLAELKATHENARKKLNEHYRRRRRELEALLKVLKSEAAEQRIPPKEAQTDD